MNGDELRTARMTAGLTQQELGDKLKVSMRTVGNWERSTGRLPRARERHIRDVLGAVGGSGDPFDGISDLALLAELGERLDRVARERSEPDDEPVDEKSTDEDAVVAPVRRGVRRVVNQPQPSVPDLPPA
jgi:transcriptional regulator with XRE-family HTH domain